MKCIVVFAIVILQFFFICLVSGQNKRKVMIDNISSEKQGDTLVVDFRILTGKKAATANRKLIMTPIVSKGKDSVLLKPVVVRARKTVIIDKRNGIWLGDEVLLADNAQQVEYSYAIPYQGWMEGARVYVEQLSSGCGRGERMPDMSLTDKLVVKQKDKASDILKQDEPSDMPEKDNSPGAFDIPVLDQVVAKWIFSRNEMIVDYEKNSVVIISDFENNRQVLSEIEKAISSVKDNPHTTINKIEITGYASPEGPVANNMYLGEIRAKALRNYLQRKFPHLKESDFNLINGGENWDRLRKLVEDSDMEFKKDVLYIIDNVPAKIDIKNNTSRKKQLMDLKGGRPYNYMYRVFFPKLRNACYVVIYYNIPAAEASAGTLHQSNQAG